MYNFDSAVVNRSISRRCMCTSVQSSVDLYLRLKHAKEQGTKDKKAALGFKYSETKPQTRKHKHTGKLFFFYLFSKRIPSGRELQKVLKKKRSTTSTCHLFCSLGLLRIDGLPTRQGLPEPDKWTC